MYPTQVYEHTVKEMNIFIYRKSLRDTETVITAAWRTINFLGGFMSGKLGDLQKYLPNTPERDHERKKKEVHIEEALKNLGF